MPTFNYVSGDPDNLTAGADADMGDIKGPFTDLKTAVNGNLDETNVPNLAAAFTSYKTVGWWSGIAGAAVVTGAGTFILWGGQVNVLVAPPSATNGMGSAALALNPADWTANARTTKLRMRMKCLTNSIAPAATLLLGLYPIATYGGGSAITPGISALGTVVTGSQAGFTTPGASTNTDTTVEFTAPVTGDYCIAFTSSGAVAANSVVQLVVQLQVRQV